MISVKEERAVNCYHFCWFRILNRWILRFGHFKKEIFENLEMNASDTSKNENVMCFDTFISN